MNLTLSHQHLLMLQGGLAEVSAEADKRLICLLVATRCSYDQGIDVAVFHLHVNIGIIRDEYPDRRIKVKSHNVVKQTDTIVICCVKPLNDLRSTEILRHVLESALYCIHQCAFVLI